MPRAVAAALLFGFVFGLSACSGSARTDSCGVAGRQRSCPCEGRAIGIQACQLDGSWETCTCYGVTAGTGGSSGAAGTSTRGAAIETDRGGAGGAGGAGVKGGTGGSTIRPPFPFAGRPARRD